MATPDSDASQVRRCKHCGRTDFNGCTHAFWWVGTDVCNGCEAMRALSVLQPWAWLLSNGHKDIENRSWATRFRGDFFIHAGKRWGREQREDLALVRHRFPSIELPATFDLGGIVGAATIVDCVDHSESPWFAGDFGFVVANAVPMKFIPCRGMLGFFRPVVSHG